MPRTVSYTATFTDLDYGYYVVAVPGATLANASGQYATLVSVDSTNVNTDIKGDLPTVDKKVQVDGTGKDATDAKIGDTLTFTLTSTIPDMSAYRHLHLQLQGYVVSGPHLWTSHFRYGRRCD